jgi:hypothetical protein
MRDFCTLGETATLEGITPHQRSQLHQRLTGSDEEKWFAVWEIVFPNTPSPSSICGDEDPQLLLEAMAENLEREGPAIIDDVMREQGIVPLPGITPEMLREVLQAEFARVVHRLGLRSLLVQRHRERSPSGGQGSGAAADAASDRPISPTVSDSAVGISSRFSSHNSRRDPPSAPLERNDHFGGQAMTGMVSSGSQPREQPRNDVPPSCIYWGE